uniref:phospholipase A2 n=1 Tax=Sergentomyia schwetzi TaxID=114605 RepID=A0A6B9VN35_9DIPT|nr:salivary phospholipase A2 [Sergentomyia schwetzi]
MNSFSVSSICISLLLIGATSGSVIGNSGLSRHIPKESFLITDHLADGEFERRISFNGLIGKQTSISETSKSLSLWQLTDGHLFLQFIYSGDDKIVDCEYIREKHHIHEFISKFNGDVTLARSHNFTNDNGYQYHQSALPAVTKHEFRNFLDNDAIPPSYQMAFDDVEDFEITNDLARKSERFGMRNFTFVELRDLQDIPSDLLPLLDIQSITEQCNQRHEEMQRIVGGIDSDDEEIRKNATEHLDRRKRALSDMFRMPNTKWCGTGNGAGIYNQLGGASRADMCCRKHDHCKLNIQAMTNKWQFFNYRFYTISSCSCDRRFRTCLKMADSPDANIVGKIFFNIVQSKCFILKPEKYCKQRSWWGECLKKGVRKRAHLRDNRKF